MYGSNCCFLTSIQIFQGLVFPSLPEFSTICVIYIVKGFSVVNKAEVNVFLELSCFFYDPLMSASDSSAFSKSSLNIWKCSVHGLLKPGLENIEHYFASVWHECNCAVVWTFFGIGMKTDLSIPVVTAEFTKFAGILSAALSQHHLLGFEIAQLEFHHLH